MPQKFIFDAVVSFQIIGSFSSLANRRRGGCCGVSWCVLGDISFSFYVHSFPLQLIVGGWDARVLTSAPSAMAASVLTLAITVATSSLALLLPRSPTVPSSFPRKSRLNVRSGQVRGLQCGS
jgi:peptidoglycan/LPS O-acetylase OafA/YrhL